MGLPIWRESAPQENPKAASALAVARSMRRTQTGRVARPHARLNRTDGDGNNTGNGDAHRISFLTRDGVEVVTLGEMRQSERLSRRARRQAVNLRPRSRRGPSLSADPDMPPLRRMGNRSIAEAARETAWSPPDAWEIMGSTITPDPSLPSAGNSFASTAPYLPDTQRPLEEAGDGESPRRSVHARLLSPDPEQPDSGDSQAAFLNNDNCEIDLPSPSTSSDDDEDSQEIQADDDSSSRDMSPLSEVDDGFAALFHMARRLIDEFDHDLGEFLAPIRQLLESNAPEVSDTDDFPAPFVHLLQVAQSRLEALCHIRRSMHRASRHEDLALLNAQFGLPPPSNNDPNQPSTADQAISEST